MSSLLWRPMLASDISAAHALSGIVHPGFPEDRAVFEERLRLYPAGCYVLASDDTLKGYALSHPYVTDCAPALNTLLGALPENCDTYYFHDIAILPEARGGQAGKAIVNLSENPCPRDGLRHDLPRRGQQFRAVLGEAWLCGAGGCGDAGEACELRGWNRAYEGGHLAARTPPTVSSLH
jgi:hypothetical protein